MVEVNITIRFLNTNPELHTELWQAEGDRSAAAIGDELGSSEELMERWKELLPAPDDKMIAKLREGVEAVRDKAHAAGVTRAPKSGPVMPSLAKMVEILDEREAREAYTLAVRELNWHVHAGARTVLQERFVKRDEHSATHLPPPDYGRRALALGISVLASTLKMCAYRLGFDEESGEAEAIRLTLVPRDLKAPTRR